MPVGSQLGTRASEEKVMCLFFMEIHKVDILKPFPVEVREVFFYIAQINSILVRLKQRSQLFSAPHQRVNKGKITVTCKQRS